MDLIFAVSGVIEIVSGLVTLLEPEAMFPEIGDGIGRVAARAWAAAVVSFGLAVYFGWRDHHEQSSSRRGAMIGVAAYNLIMVVLFTNAIAVGSPAMGVHTTMPADMQTVARFSGLGVHTLLFLWSALWINESGKLSPDHVYISNLPKTK